MLDPGRLNTMQGAVRGETFNRRHRRPGGQGSNGHAAGADRRTVHENRAGPARADPASVFRSGEVEFIPEGPEEGHLSFDIQIPFDAVDDEFHNPLLIRQET
jgi:hypothetical protein